MNAKHLIAAVAAIVSTSSVLAQEYVAPDAKSVSTKTRADVIAELKEARANGSLDTPDHAYPVIRIAGPAKSRAEVTAELAEARTRSALNAPDGSYPVIQNATSKTRDQVRAELQQYLRTQPQDKANDLYLG